ncbi:HAD family phosphatase [Acaryochloris sp. 'Moss Beach']|uniref:HAD family hydrolase n=1 Tax=Acaryochloris TaxID=155977 RepID=UPI001BAF3AEE|nr:MULTISPECIES: HAD family phosphatase [Acaryochloris]QUY43108.1 HAD family phosphatase [Acaryochloris marina S15]UJB67979.1 HAD family phosphatase [Acaryochloris sp. 'Moss Beach']
MPLKAVLFDFNGVVLDDERIHQQIIWEMMEQEDLPLTQEELQLHCLGRTDRACFQDLFASMEQPLNQFQLRRLLSFKAKAYRQYVESLENLPIFEGVIELIGEFLDAGLTLAIVSGALRAEVQMVLKHMSLEDAFPITVTSEDVKKSKPDPAGYQLAIKRLNRKFPTLDLDPCDCLAIEDSFAGIQAAKQAQIPVVGVAHTLPFHMLQRQANWCVDYLHQIELDRIQTIFAR